MADVDADHHCHADDCPTAVPERLFLCPKHWFMLPKTMRDRVWALYRPGQETRKDPSAEYLEHTRKCIEFVKAEEAKRAGAKIKKPSPAKARETAAVKRLVVEMGAEVVFSMRPHEELSKLERVKLRGVDVDGALQAEWPERLTAASQVAVVWDTPEHAATGSASWRMMCFALKHAGLANVSHTWLVPQMLRDDGVPRAPKADELAEWRDHWLASMAAADTRYALLVGGVVGNVWRADVPYADLLGRWGALADRWWCQMIPHPGMVARGLVTMKDFRSEVAGFADRVLAGDERASSWLRTGCTEGGCGEKWFAWDRDGLPWCEEHAVKHLVGAKGGGRRTKRTGQGVLL